MRKEVKLGLSIGGMAAIVLGYVTLFGDKTDKHPVELADQTNSEVGGEVDQSTTPIKGIKDNSQPTVLIATDTDKGDAVWGKYLWPNSNVTQTPDPAGGRAGGITREPDSSGRGIGGTLIASNTGSPTGSGIGNFGQSGPSRAGTGAVGGSTAGNITGGSTGGTSGASGQLSNGLRTSTADTRPIMSAGGQAKVYKIQQGDTFSSIAARTYGDRNLYRIIVAANPKVDPSHLKIGTEIVVPDSSTIHPASSPEARTAVGTIGNRAEAKLDSKTEYRVASGDSLHRISTRLYGNINMVDKLYELNKNAIGADPAKLKLGMVLKLPAAAHAQVN